MLDPHVARMLGFAYDDLLALSGQEYAYKVSGIWRGARHEVDGSKLKLADFLKQLTKAGAKVKQTSKDTALNFPAGALEFAADYRWNGCTRVERRRRQRTQILRGGGSQTAHGVSSHAS